MMSDTRMVRLQADMTEGNRRFVNAFLSAEGDLSIEGQDLGSGVSEFFGAGLTEYEWTVVVRAEHVPSAVAALGGEPDTEILDLLGERDQGDEAHTIKERLDAAGVMTEFWSRIGD